MLPLTVVGRSFEGGDQRDLFACKLTQIIEIFCCIYQATTRVEGEKSPLNPP